VLGGLALVVMLAGLLLGGRAALAALLLSVLGGGILLLFEQSGLLRPVLARLGSARVFLVIHVPHLVFCGLVISQFVRRNQSVLAQARAATAAEAEARQQVEATSRARAAFLANVSHELRTPLSVILGGADLLVRSPSSGDADRHLGAIQRSAQSLERLVDDILDTRAIEVGVMAIEAKPLSLEEVLEAVVERHQTEAEALGLSLTVRIDPNCCQPLVGDRDRLVQVLSNLVSNAGKYTDKGSVAVAVVGRLDQQSMRLEISVVDSGPGMAAEFLDVMFEPFTRTASAVELRGTGMGLGLSITKGLVEAMGGSIAVQSTLGSGSTLSVHLLLPLAEQPVAVAVAGSSAGQAAGTGQAASVLVVDDAAMVRDVFAAMLERLGCHVSQAANGEEAVELCAGTAFELVLMDLQMPTMDGFEAAAAIRASDHRSAVPIVALSADCTDETHELCRAAGIDELVRKPVGLDVIRRILQSYAPAAGGGEGAAE